MSMSNASTRHKKVASLFRCYQLVPTSLPGEGSAAALKSEEGVGVGQALGAVMALDSSSHLRLSGHPVWQRIRMSLQVVNLRADVQ